MAIYAIGDLQGCHDALLRLLEHVHFDPASDRLWFVGDLVNRGPQSLQCLRFVQGLGDRAITVLGNHDLHLLAIRYGNNRHYDNHSLDDILQAPDSDELLDWLRHRPLLYHDSDAGYTLIHAGLPPQWSLATARRCANEVEVALRAANPAGYFMEMYGNKPDQWSDDLQGQNRLRFITNCLTRLRYCTPGGKLAMKHKGPPGSQPAGVIPWFSVPARATAGERIVFGHWSTLGCYIGHNAYAIDTGCVWGGQLTALRLGDEPKVISIDCPQTQQPGG